MVLKSQAARQIELLTEAETREERQAILEILQDCPASQEIRIQCKHIALKAFLKWVEKQTADPDITYCREYLGYLLAGDYSVDPAWASHETTESLGQVLTALNTGAAMTAALSVAEVTDLWEVQFKAVEQCLYLNPFLTEYTMFLLVVRILDALNEQDIEIPVPLECALRLYLVWGMGGRLSDNAMAWVLGEYFDGGC